MPARVIPRICAAVFVAGIAGIIATSIVSNNNGLVLAIGGVIVLAAVALLTYSTTVGAPRIDVFDEAAAEAVEARIGRLVAAGASEDEVRGLVRDASRLRTP